MVVDEQLLEKARQAAAKVAEASREALLAKAEYHTAVRRMHLAGGSLREIAEALGISHQRVQQVVEAAGGSWWQRVWRNRGQRRDAVCTACGRPPSEVKKLVAGPNVYLCDQCVTDAEHAIAGRAAAGFSLGRKPRAKCSFCGKPTAPSRILAVRGEIAACSECVRVCRAIIESSEAPAL